MLSVEERKHKYLEAVDKEELETVMNDIEEYLYEVPFKQCHCEIPLHYEIDNKKNISDYLKSLGYEYVIIKSYDANTTVCVGWDASTDDDKYYISNSSHPYGSFEVKKLILSNDWLGKRKLAQMKHCGNYFDTEEEAQEVAKEFNKILYEHKHHIKAKAILQKAIELLDTESKVS